MAPEPEPLPSHIVMDDGSGGAWEVAAGVSKKQQKQKEKAEEAKRKEEEEKIAAAKAAKAELKAAKAAGGKVDPVAASQAKAKAAIAKATIPDRIPTVAEITAAAAKAAQATVKAQQASQAAEAAKEAGAPAEPDNSVSAVVNVPAGKIGRIIGPKGATITAIKEKTGVKTVDTAGDVVTIVGQPDQVAAAEVAVKELIEKGYMSLAWEDFKEGGLNVHPSSIPDIIGSKGAHIQAIKKECNVEIDIEQVPKGAPAGKKVKVSIAGAGAGVEKAKDIINDLALFGHHEVTHPGFGHEEMDIEEWKYRFLIGKGGSEMRHIQNSYKVKVNIPREHSANQKVVVVGEARDVERAVKYIEKILTEAEQPKGRETQEKAEDTWGDEPPEEAWMSGYMYKRK